MVEEHIHKMCEFSCLEHKCGQASQIHDISVAQIFVSRSICDVDVSVQVDLQYPRAMKIHPTN